LCALLGLCALAGCEKKQAAADILPAPAPIVNPHSVTLNWTPSKSKVAGYNVYRALPKAKPVKLTDGIVLATEYTDTTVEAGRTYTYYVTSVDLTGLEGVSSKGIEVKVPATTPETPAANH
jgi:fibronectin type 3 domain-containing protein